MGRFSAVLGWPRLGLPRSARSGRTWRAGLAIGFATMRHAEPPAPISGPHICAVYRRWLCTSAARYTDEPVVECVATADDALPRSGEWCVDGGPDRDYESHPRRGRVRRLCSHGIAASDE